jgi:two-component system sensor histidine kinase TctE
LRNEIDRPRLSFAAKFIEWLLGPLVYLWLATAAFGIFMIAQAVDESFDARLEDLAKAVAGHVVATGDPHAPFKLGAAGEALLHADRFDDRHYALRPVDGPVFAGDSDMPQVTGAIGDDEVSVQGGVLGDDTVRIAALALPAQSAADGRVVLQVAETMARRRELTASLRAESFLPQLLLLGGSFVLVWYGLTYVIAPMRRLKSAIDARDSLDLTPIDPVQAPEEMRPLIESVNALLARVEDNFEVQRRFIADAAHQLRTPLAGLKSQTELALAERDPVEVRRVLQRLEQATARTIHLANRLLALARAGTVHAPHHVPVALLPVVREVVGEFVPRAVERDIDFGIETDDADSATVMRADPLLIHELVTNLVDNALRYTPPGGVVTVAVRRTRQGSPELDVVDSGPGIPADERERVFDPFYRGADAAPGGTGLGLAIVRAIANAHHAQIRVGAGKDGKGAVVRVTFPPPQA